MTYPATRRPRRPGGARVSLQLEPSARAIAQIVCGSPSPKLMLDRSLCILSHNHAWADLVGVEQDVNGRNYYEVFPNTDTHSRSVFAWALAGNSGGAGRIQLRRVDGKTFWCDAELVAWRNDAGEVGGVVHSISPVAETVAAEDRDLRSQRRLSMATKLASVYIWEMDFARGEIETNGVDIGVDDRKFTYQELVSDPFISCHPDDRERQKAHSDAAMASGTCLPVEYRVNRADGAVVWVSAISELVFEDGRPVRLIGAMQNITERKLAELELAAAHEAANAANHAKSNFLANMSHEIRTPLNGVLGLAQVMALDELPPAQRERLTVIRQSGEALLELLNDTLDLAKIEAGKFELDEVEFSLSDLARGVHGLFSPAAERKGLSFDFVVDEPARGRYLGDRLRIRQILNNLVSNALKFTETGSVLVQAGIEGPDLNFVVRDTGPGMSEAVAESLFQKFVQADASTARNFGGTGLGLAICRDLTDLMGGRVSVRSLPGAGSVFCVSLPLARIGGEADHQLAGEAEEMPLVLQEGAVLLAEDNKTNQLVVKSLLAHIGVSPVAVDDGEAAIAAWASGNWDLILMDVQMPRLDGVAATREIRRREANEGRPRTPIVALTANAMAHQRDTYFAAGMDAVLSKPLNATELLTMVSEFITGGRADHSVPRCAGSDVRGQAG
jgi:PAS domain S-box-containing protein